MSAELMVIDSPCADGICADEQIEVYDDNSYISDSESEPLLDVWSSPFISDIEALALKYIKLFFNGKKMYYGGPIPRNLPTRQQYIDRVLCYNIDNAVKAIYDAWHTAALGVVTLKEVRRINLIGRIPSDVEAVLEVLRECSNLGVPKPLAGGIAMMYFELCEGFNFQSTEAPVAINVA